MEYAARLPRFPSRRAMAAPVVALVVGAGVATGAYALIDNGDGAAVASKVIVVEDGYEVGRVASAPGAPPALFPPVAHAGPVSAVESAARWIWREITRHI